MKIAKTAGIMGLVCCSALCSSYVTAADTGWYAGMGVGQSRAVIDNDKISNELRSLGFATAAVTAQDDHNTAYKFYGGYKFTRNFALEGGYFYLGKYRFTATTTGPAGTLSGDVKPRGLNLDAVGMLPIAGKFSALARLGVQYAEAGDSFVGAGAVSVASPNPGRRETNFKLGLGGQYDLTDSVGLRGEWERYRIRNASSSSGDINFFSAGVFVKF